MEESYIADLLNEIEEKFPVDKWIVDDIHIWPLIRIDLRFNLYYLNRNPSYTNSLSIIDKIRYGTNILAQVPRFVYAYLYDFRNNDKPRESKVVFLTDTDLRTYLEDTWYDRLCNPFIEYLEKRDIKPFVMEKSQKYLVPRHSPTMYIQPYLNLATIKAAAFKTQVKAEDSKLQKFNEFVNFINLKNLGIPSPNFVRLQLIVSLVKQYKMFFKKILQEVNPKVGFLTSYQNPVGMAFNLACRELGITSIEIQHGIQGDYNVAYGQWNKVPRNGYELLPAVFWCWSNYEAQAIKKWSKKVSNWHKPLIGGNLFLNLYKSKYSSLNKTYGEIISRQINIKQINILVSLSMVNNDSNLKELFAAMKQAPKLWKWWIRIHPCSLQSKNEIIAILEKHSISNYEIDLATKLPLFTILNWMNVHVTYDSAVTIDAYYMNIPTVVTSKDAWIYFPRQLRSKFVHLAYTTEAITNSIKSLAKTRPKEYKTTSNNFLQAYKYLTVLLKSKSSNN